jgi:hypothetical protein
MNATMIAWGIILVGLGIFLVVLIAAIIKGNTDE